MTAVSNYPLKYLFNEYKLFGHPNIQDTNFNDERKNLKKGNGAL